MTRVVVVRRTGGPEVLELDRVEVDAPGPGRARVQHRAIGLNFIDTYQRSGLYPLPLPTGLGSEAAGIVDAVGPGVSEIAVGDRVAYAGGPPGPYADARIIAADRLCRLPDAIDFETAAAMMLKAAPLGSVSTASLPTPGTSNPGTWTCPPSSAAPRRAPSTS